ncbi:MAG: hypothetical protein MPN21_04585 [Thermoanaerobaculia bacterium]|nr:hypothetical protein [Thermoanaerobaculia bacterium]
MIAVLLSAEEGAPVDVFGELDGTWEGTFVGYDLEGIEQYRIQVRQVYRTVDDETQVVQIEDRMADGAVVRGEGANVARRLPDGSLELLCRVEKSNGDRVEHRGRLVSGPDGRKEIVWYSRESKRREMFREWVHHDAEGPVYAIEGVGQYGETTVVMSGRYRKID